MALLLDHNGNSIASSAVDGILTINNTGAIRVPVGNTIARPSSPLLGHLRANSDTNVAEFFDGTAWVNLLGGGSGAGVEADNAVAIAIALLS